MVLTNKGVVLTLEDHNSSLQEVAFKAIDFSRANQGAVQDKTSSGRERNNNTRLLFQNPRKHGSSQAKRLLAEWSTTTKTDSRSPCYTMKESAGMQPSLLMAKQLQCPSCVTTIYRSDAQLDITLLSQSILTTCMHWGALAAAPLLQGVCCMFAACTYRGSLVLIVILRRCTAVGSQWLQNSKSHRRSVHRNTSVMFQYARKAITCTSRNCTEVSTFAMQVVSH